MQTYQKHLEEFDAYLTLKNFSKATRNAYGCALRQFFAYREKHGMEGLPCLLALLREYYRAYRPKGLLFNGKVVGRPWAQRSAQWAAHNARKAARVEREVSPHVFRHCYATHHLENGTNLVYLKEQLGHKHLKTTAKYIRLCKSYQKQVRHPIAGMAITYRKNIL